MALKVVSYNIRDGGSDRLSTILEIVQAQRPDVVALIEAFSAIASGVGLPWRNGLMLWR